MDGHAWLVGYRGAETVPVTLEWTGQAWEERRPPAECVRGGTSFGGMPNLCVMAAVKAFAADDVWAAGNGAWTGFIDPLLFHWDGTGWQVVDGLPAKALPGVAVDKAGSPWVLANTREPSATLSTFAAGQWADTPAPAPPDTVGMALKAITAVPGTTRFIAVGAADLPTTPRLLQAVLLEYA